MIDHTEVAIIGGGPAGSTAAILLAKMGFKVALFEKDEHPRYHIGESGILSLPFILQLLDLEEEVQKLGCKKKGGVYFDWNEKWLINWSESGQYTYHVIRSEFDHLLLQKAKSLGVQVYEKAQVKKAHFEGDKITAIDIFHNEKAFSVVTDYVLDASGRNALLARHYLKSQKPLQAFQNVALWGYWLKVKDPHTLKGFQEVNGYSSDLENPIVLSAIPNGWIWGIPLHNKTWSVGTVLSQKYYNEAKKEGSKKELYIENLKKSETFRSLLKSSYLVSDVKQTQDWSYYTTKWGGENYFLVGDSAVFIDPLLSTGMTSAMLSAVTASACMQALHEKKLSADAVRRFYKEDYQKRFWRLSFVIGSLYGIKSHPEDLFSKTHQLTSKDLSGEALKEIKASFSSVISGLEDVKELSAFDLQKIASDRLKENFQEYVHIIPKMPYLEKSELELKFYPLQLSRSI